jgi:hypothetical protein
MQYRNGSIYCRCVSIKKANSFAEFINEVIAWNVPVSESWEGVKRDVFLQLSAAVWRKFGIRETASNHAQKGRGRRKNRAVTRGYNPARGITLFGSTPLTPDP